MQLRIQVYNNNIFKNLENILYSDDRQVARWFMQNLPGEVYEQLSPQYEIQVQSGMQIRKTLGPNAIKNIKWFYFGTEQCEYLMPTLAEVKEAIQIMKDFDKKYVTKDIKQFVMVTPYYGHTKIKDRILEVLQYLHQNAYQINPKTKIVEVVINDWGTWQLIKKHNLDKLKPILWRLLVKTLKNPLVDTFGLEKNVHIPGEMMKNKTPQQIQELKKQIANNQRKGFGRSALNNQYFIRFLDKKWIQRAGIDYQQDYPSLYQVDDIPIDVYYPYALIFVGRLCDTSSLENVRRWYYAIDEICPRTCLKYDLNIQNFDTVGYKILQRGNAQFKSQISLNIPQDALEKYENRLIYAPLI